VEQTCSIRDRRHASDPQAPILCHDCTEHCLGRDRNCTRPSKKITRPSEKIRTAAWGRGCPRGVVGACPQAPKPKGAQATGGLGVIPAPRSFHYALPKPAPEAARGGKFSAAAARLIRAGKKSSISIAVVIVTRLANLLFRALFIPGQRRNVLGVAQYLGHATETAALDPDFLHQ
jgi:hypothetical protein